MPGQLERRSKPLTASSRSSRVFPPGRIINLGIRTAFQPFPTSESLPCCSDSGGSIIHPSAPPYPFLFFRLLFLPDAEETAKDPSFDVLSLVSPSSSLFPLAVEVTQDQPRETCSLPSFLSLFLSLSISACLLFHWFFRSLVFSRFSSPLYSLPRENQIIRVVPLMKNTSIRVSSRKYFIERDKCVLVNSFSSK